MALKSLKSGQKLAKAGEATGFAGKKQGPVRGAVPGFVPGTLTGCLPFDGGGLRMLSRPFSSSETNW